MRILVTGSSGFIGFHLCLSLLKKGFEVTGVDNLNDYYKISLKQHRQNILEGYKNFTSYNCDLNDMQHTVNGKFNIAINLAAQAGVRLSKSENYKYIDSNINGFDSFLKFCEFKNIYKIIYSSSSSVYSGNISDINKESDLLNKPKSFYADTKIKNELCADIHAKNTGSKIIGLRFFTVYGPLGRPDMAYFNFTNKILSRNKITLFNSGNTHRDMTFIDDVSDAIESSIEKISKVKEHEIFNIASENPINTNKLIRAIEEEFNMKAIKKNLLNKNEVSKTHADCSKAKAFLKYNPKIKFEEGINKFFNWYRDFYKL